MYRRASRHSPSKADQMLEAFMIKFNGFERYKKGLLRKRMSLLIPNE
jgi:hypothetical protein